MSDQPFDPFIRPAGALNAVEPKILIAAFAAPSLAASESGAMVPVTFGVPVRVSRNTKSAALVVTVQSNRYGNLVGTMGSSASTAASSTAIPIPFDTKTLQQILLAKEELWLVLTRASGAITHLIVTEVTP